MTHARFNNTNYNLETEPTLTFSARETTFSEIVIDFTGKSANDLPGNYQEIQIINDAEEVIYYGYCSQPTFPEFDGKQERVLLTIELLSPQTYLTKRTANISVVNVNIHDALGLILAETVSKDGFTIAENNMPTTEYLSDKFYGQTVETILSNLGGRFNFLWYVNEVKEIFIRYLPNIENEGFALDITNVNIPNLQSVQPTFQVCDYANKLNISNVDLITNEILLESGSALELGETYTFPHPFSISEFVVYRFKIDSYYEIYPIFYLQTTDSFEYTINVDIATQTLVWSEYIGISGVDDDNPSKHLLFELDTENQNLITGFKWNTTTTAVKDYPECKAYTCIVPSTMTYSDADEISKNAEKTNTSGIIEKEIDANSKYYTYPELTAYAKSLFKQNNIQADQVVLKFRGYDLSNLRETLTLTKKIFVNLPEQFIENMTLVITDIEYSVEQNIYALTVSGRRSNLTENYVDIFKSTTDISDADYLKFTTFYNQDEKTVISENIIINGEKVNV